MKSAYKYVSNFREVDETRKKKYELIVIQLLQKKLQSDLIPKYFI